MTNELPRNPMGLKFKYKLYFLLAVALVSTVLLMSGVPAEDVRHIIDPILAVFGPTTEVIQ